MRVQSATCKCDNQCGSLKTKLRSDGYIHTSMYGKLRRLVRWSPRKKHRIRTDWIQEITHGDAAEVQRKRRLVGLASGPPGGVDDSDDGEESVHGNEPEQTERNEAGKTITQIRLFGYKKSENGAYVFRKPRNAKCGGEL